MRIDDASSSRAALEGEVPDPLDASASHAGGATGHFDGREVSAGTGAAGVVRPGAPLGQQGRAFAAALARNGASHTAHGAPTSLSASDEHDRPPFAGASVASSASTAELVAPLRGALTRAREDSGSGVRRAKRMRANASVQFAQTPSAETRVLQGAVAVEVVRHLPPDGQVALARAVRHRPGDRYELARSLPEEQLGAYLALDKGVRAEALKGTEADGSPLPADVLLARAAWVLKSGLIEEAANDGTPNELIVDDLRRADQQLRQSFVGAGPDARAGAVRSLAQAASQTRELVGASYLVEHVLQRLDALPARERAAMLTQLVKGLNAAHSDHWSRLKAPYDDPDVHEEERDSGEATTLSLHRETIEREIPLFLGALGHVPEVPADLAHSVVGMTVTNLDCGMPDAATQCAALTLIDQLLPRMNAGERVKTALDLALMLNHFARPDDQMRVLDIVQRPHHGLPTSRDQLANVPLADREDLVSGLVNKLEALSSQDVRGALINLLDNQFHPQRIAEFAPDEQEAMLSTALQAEIDGPNRSRLFRIVERALDAQPGEHAAGPLWIIASAVGGVEDRGLANRMTDALLRLVPRVPLDQRGNLLALCMSQNRGELNRAAAAHVAALPQQERAALLVDIGEPHRLLFALGVAGAFVRMPSDGERMQMLDIVQQTVSRMPMNERGAASGRLAERVATSAAAAATAGGPADDLAQAARQFTERLLADLPEGQVSPVVTGLLAHGTRNADDVPAFVSQVLAEAAVSHLHAQAASNMPAFQALVAGMTTLDVVAVFRGLASALVNLPEPAARENAAALLGALEAMHPMSERGRAVVMATLASTLIALPAQSNHLREHLATMFAQGVAGLPSAEERANALTTMARALPLLPAGAESTGFAVMGHRDWAISLLAAHLPAVDPAYAGPILAGMLDAPQPSERAAVVQSTEIVMTYLRTLAGHGADALAVMARSLIPSHARDMTQRLFGVFNNLHHQSDDGLSQAALQERQITLSTVQSTIRALIERVRSAGPTA